MCTSVLFIQSVPSFGAPYLWCICGLRKTNGAEGSSRSEGAPNVQNTKICCGLFWTECNSSHRNQYSEAHGSISLIIIRDSIFLSRGSSPNCYLNHCSIHMFIYMLQNKPYENSKKCSFTKSKSTE